MKNIGVSLSTSSREKTKLEWDMMVYTGRKIIISIQFYLCIDKYGEWIILYYKIYSSNYAF